MILHSYAKLNLYLEVLRRRTDGYHSIRTIFERISLFDTIRITTRRDRKICVFSDSALLPGNSSKNLVYVSAKLLQNSFHIDRGVTIRIKKRIPIGAGLGGGSSNAAYTLMGLNRLWRLNLTQRELVQLARSIGSDVPFFIYDCPFAQGEARGDRIKPLTSLGAVKLWHVLVVPRLQVLTPTIYCAWDKRIKNEKKRTLPTLTTPRYGVKILILALQKNNLPLTGEAVYNSLQEITPGLYPEITRARNTLQQFGLKAILMSGSGPAVFGIVSSRKEAETLCKQLRAIEKSWQAFAVQTR